MEEKDTVNMADEFFKFYEELENLGEVKYIFYLVVGIAGLLIIRGFCIDFSTFPIAFIGNFFESCGNGALEIATRGATLLIDVVIIVATIMIGRGTIPIVVLIIRFILTGIQIIIERMKENEHNITNQEDEE